MSGLRVGFDLVEIAEVADSLAAHGDRYLRRILTSSEREWCDGRPPRLAAHFAAKEATFKALERTDEPIAWTDVEVIPAVQAGRHGLRLTGAAKAAARTHGVARLELTISQTAGHAAALVIARSAALVIARLG